MRIVIYKGTFQYDVVNDFATAVGAVLQSHGHEVVLLDLTLSKASQMLLETFQQPVDMVISFNGIGYNFTIENQSLYDYVNTVFVMWLVDHPVHLMERVTAKIQNKIVVCIDETHVDYLENNRQDHIVTTFIPHAIHPYPYNREFLTKKYDVVFAGHIPLIEEAESKIDEISQMIPNIKPEIEKELQVYGNVDLGKWILNKYQQDKTLETVLSKNIEYENYILYWADRFIRARKRIDVIERMLKNGIAIDFFGSISPDHYFNQYTNFKAHGIVSFNEMKNIFKDSKIVLNVLPNFPNGGHERIFTSMMCGALPLSDQNVYIAQHLNKILSFEYNQLENYVDTIKEHLTNEELWVRKIDENYHLVCKQHTWENRLNDLFYVYDIAKEYFRQNKN